MILLRPALMLVLLLGLAPRSTGQEEVDLRRPLDQTVDDRGGLARSLRLIEPGLRVPSGFEQVYRVPGRDDLMMRVDGGLYAVFPASRYQSTRQGVIALIPSDTVFHLGPPDASLLPTPAPVTGATPGAGAPVGRVTRPPGIETSPGLAPAAPGGASGPGVSPSARWDGRLLQPEGVRTEAGQDRTVATDDAYRAARLRELVRRAARAERGEAR